MIDPAPSTRFDPSADDPRIVGALAARTRLDEAMRDGDVTALGESFADDLIVHIPGHRAVPGAKILELYAKGGQAMYADGMSVEFDFVGVRQGAVVMIGLEIMPRAPGGPFAGKLVRRRFTDVWHELDGAWKLTIRQATNISIDD
jgi:hypothetical protein